MSDYELGVKDCEMGIPAKHNANEEYVSGYGWQYQKEQIDYEQCKRDMGNAIKDRCI